MKNVGQKYPAKHILVINLGGIGDFLLSTPGLRALRKLYPDARIDFLGVPRTCDFARQFLVSGLSHGGTGTHLFGEVVAFGAYDEKNRTFLVRRFAQVLRLLLILRKKKFDMAINMRTLVSWLGAWKMACLFALVGARYRVGRDTAGRGFFLNIKIEESGAGDKHEMDYDLETVGLLGADVSDDSFDVGIFSDAAVEKTIEARLSGFGIRASDFLVAAYAGGAPSHRWPRENFSRALEAIAEKSGGVGLMLDAAPEGRSAIAPAGKPKIFFLTESLSIQELAALLKRCRLFLTNDTGPMHIAAVLGVPMVAVFGPGYLTRFDPRRISERAVVVYKQADCAPCNKVECVSLKCLREIAPDEIVTAALGLIESART